MVSRARQMLPRWRAWEAVDREVLAVSQRTGGINTVLRLSVQQNLDSSDFSTICNTIRPPGRSIASMRPGKRSNSHPKAPEQASLYDC